MHTERDRYPGFAVPALCLPATIDNNLPGWETSIGADTALNEIVSGGGPAQAVGDGVTARFVVEVMGKYCGYLALLAGLAAGAEQVYLHEDGITLAELTADVRACGTASGPAAGCTSRSATSSAQRRVHH